MTSNTGRIGRAVVRPFRLLARRESKRTGDSAGLSSRGIWLVMALIGLTIIVVEIIDHNTMHAAHGTSQLLVKDRELIREIIMYGVSLPVIGGILLTLLYRRGAERDMAENELERQRAFAEELQELTDWNELKERIVNFPAAILPAVRSYLTVFDLDDHHADLVSTWTADEADSVDRVSAPTYRSCRECLDKVEGTVHEVLTCGQMDADPLSESRKRFCLPLTSSDDLLAVLTFELGEGQQVVDHQRRMLLGNAPHLAAAIENVQLQRSRQSLSEVAATERQRIGRNLHDTLAQNITYLRLKLDQLGAENGSLQDFAAVQHEVERMRVVADEAYLQVRETLADLDQDSPVELADALAELVKATQARTSAPIRLASHGSPLPLPAYTQRQLLFVSREALNNALKHADASFVRVELIWGATDLTITIADDGRGFCPDDEFASRGYGLNIMQSRAESLGGRLTVESAPNQGTAVSLTLPAPVPE